MPLRIDAPANDLTVVREWDHGFTWMAHPDARMRRASHAIAVDGDVWVIDPLDADGLDEKLANLGEVAGVVLLGSHHQRHVDRLAGRHEVAVRVPAWFEESARDFDAPVEFVSDALEDTGFELLELRNKPWRQEGGLYHPERRTLAVSDTLMTTLFSGEEGRVELFPPARLAPTYDPLLGLEVDRLLVGHGEPVFEDASAKIERALNQEYRGTTGAFLSNLPTFARMVGLAVRG